MEMNFAFWYGQRLGILMSKKSLSIWGLLMINLAALGGIRSWASIAECGSSTVFFVILAAVGFFIPISLIAAELATAIPREGGVYAWVKESYGHRFGFLAIWLLWIENVTSIPLFLSFIVSTIAFAFDPSLIHNKIYTVSMILVIFWGTTLINLKGMKALTWLSSIGAICGTFIAGTLIITFGFLWFLSDRPLEISLQWKALLPESMTSFSQLALLGGVVLSFLGIEMSSVHAAEVHNPQKNYPKAIFLTFIAAVLFSVLGVLSISMVIPREQIVLSAGGLQAFQVFFENFGLKSLLPIIAIIISLGTLGSMSTWIVGPCVGLVAAAERGNLPSFLRKTNTNGVPQNLLIFQACFVSILAFFFLFMPTLNSAYWMFIVLTTQLYLIMYILLFASAIKLRYTQPNLDRPFKVPGGKKGIWILGGAGILSSAFTAVVCFFPPGQLVPGNEWNYVLFLLISIILSTAAPFWLTRSRKKLQLSS